MTDETLSATAVLFDMDGTLIDSTDAVARVWGRFADLFDLDVETILATSHGVRMVETVQRHAPAGTDIAAVVAELSAAELLDEEGIVALPGAAEFLASLPAERVALVTSASRELAISRMAAAGLPMPAVLVTADDVDAGKPQPDCYLLAARRLGVEAADAVVFEDADAGIRAGLASGARVVVVGDLVSEATAGLTRVADYRGVTATPGAGGMTLRFA